METRPYNFERCGPTAPRILRFASATLAVVLGLVFTAPALSDEPPAPQARFTVDAPEEAVIDGIEVDVLDTVLPHVSLSWEVEQEEDIADDRTFVFTLQQAGSPDFSDPKTLYEGRDRSSFRGGLPEGNVFYRVRAADENGTAGEWSRPLQVRVAYQSMRDAIALFAIGGVVVLATVVLVVAGSRKDREEARKEEAS